MTLIATSQLSFDFDPLLQERFPTKREYLAYLILTHKDPQKLIAANLDMSPSTLTRKVAPQDGDCQRFTLDDEEKLYRAYPDIAQAAITYDASKWCDTGKTKMQRLLSRLEKSLNDRESIEADIKQLKEMLS